MKHEISCIIGFSAIGKRVVRHITRLLGHSISSTQRIPLAKGIHECLSSSRSQEPHARVSLQTVLSVVSMTTHLQWIFSI